MFVLLPHGLERPLVFSPDTAHIAGMLQSVLTGWPMKSGGKLAGKPLLRIFADGGEIVVERPEDGGIFHEPTAVSAVCSLVVEVVDALAAASPGLVCLHAAAAEAGGRLVLFPAAHRAGKSTLMGRLSAGGRRIFADDILPFDLTSGEAVSTGCMTRLRLPLPRRASRAFKNHVRDRTVLSDGYYAYLSAPKDAEIRFGERLPLGAVILLERCDRPVRARLEPAPLYRALLEILTRNTRGDRDAPLLLSTFASIIRHVPVQRLVYSDLEDAVRCLDVAFGKETPASPHPIQANPVIRDELSGLQVKPAGPPAPKPGLPLYRRSPSVTLERVDASGFLLDSRGNGIHMLDPLGLGVWKLLETPRDASSLCDVVAGAFPETPRQKVADDIDGLLSALVGEGLIERVGASCPERIPDRQTVTQPPPAGP